MSSVISRVRDLAGDLLAVTGVTQPRRAVRGRLAIVTFHRVLPVDRRAAYPLPGLVVTPNELSWFLGFLCEHFVCGSLDGVLQRWLDADGSGQPVAAITFDDGQLDNFVFARPVLEKAGVRGTFFVPVGAVEENAPLWHDRLGFAALAVLLRGGKPRDLLRELDVTADDPRSAVRRIVSRAKTLDPASRAALVERVERLAGGQAVPEWDGMMSWEQLAALADAGHEIGSHSMTHAFLPRCSDLDLAREVQASRAVIEERLGRPVRSFCYPDGDHDGRVVQAVREAGYVHAVTTRWGTNARSASLLTLRRCDMISEHVVRSDGRLSETRLAWRLSGLYPRL